MATKTRKQKMRRATAALANGGVVPTVTPTPRKSVHDKKTRPNMKARHKHRLGLESPDIYEGFEEKCAAGAQWVCPKCTTPGRVIGYCVRCQQEAIGETPKLKKAIDPKKVAGAKKFKKVIKKIVPTTGGTRLKK